MCQRNIRVIPIAQTAKTLEFIALVVNVGQGKVTANFAQLNVRNGIAVFYAGFFAGFQFRRQSMCIPARYIRCLITGHILRPNNNVLQGLVKRCAKMNVTVGIRRAIMQDKDRFPFVLFHDLPIQVLFFPRRQRFRFPLRQVCLHGKVRFWQVQSAFVIHQIFILLQHLHDTSYYRLNAFY